MELNSLDGKQVQQHLELLGYGNERGLTFFYQHYYPWLYSWAFKTTKADCCSAMSIVQDAFLKLWLCRLQIKTVEQLLQFLKTQVKVAIGAYYRQSKTKFRHCFLAIDGLELHHQDYLLAAPAPRVAEDLAYLEGLEQERATQLTQLKMALPSLKKEQQLLVGLCLKYGFNYDRIVYHLGGGSSYKVEMKIENTLKELRKLFIGSEKLAMATHVAAKPCYEGDFTAEQEEVFKMRYVLGYSFEQIAGNLQLSEMMVKQLFVAAHDSIKITKMNGYAGKQRKNSQ